VHQTANNPAGIAVDGSLLDLAAVALDVHAGIFHTLNTGVQFWSVDFGVVRRIQRVYIQSRNNHMDRLNGAQIWVGNQNTPFNNVCGTIVTGALVNNVDCNAFGRYLHVTVNNVFLHFAELMAFRPCACPAGQYDSTF